MNKKIILLFCGSLFLSGCSQSLFNRDTISSRTLALMTEKNMSPHDPIIIRIYKKESELEVWKRKRNGTYALLRVYPICRWSGQLGPKKREGDRQAPEGFYTVTASMMNPNSRHFRSFNLGFPNEYDRAHGYTGSYLMVHGGCSSRGCYSMTDGQMSEIYALMRESFAAGQKEIQIHALPFRMTHRNLAAYRSDARMPFWSMLKQGTDIFELTHTELKVSFCNRRYVFNAIPANPNARFSIYQPCPAFQTSPALAQAIMNKNHQDENEINALVARGTPATQRLYEDGDQHALFRKSSSMEVGDAEKGGSALIYDVSRPEALVRGPQEILIAANSHDENEDNSPMLTASTLYSKKHTQDVVPSLQPFKEPKLVTQDKKPKQLQFKRTVPGRRGKLRTFSSHTQSPTFLHLRHTLGASLNKN